MTRLPWRSGRCSEVALGEEPDRSHRTGRSGSGMSQGGPGGLGARERRRLPLPARGPARRARRRALLACHRPHPGPQRRHPRDLRPRTSRAARRPHRCAHLGDRQRSRTCSGCWTPSRRTTSCTSSTSGAPGCRWTGMVAEEPLDPRRAAWLVREVARAIAATHAPGVAHGRLLPETSSCQRLGLGQAHRLRGRRGALRDGSRPTTRRRRRGEPAQRPRERRTATSGRCSTPPWSGAGPGRPASVVPDAPLDHGQVCRPRQVRAGVPRARHAVPTPAARRGECRGGSSPRRRSPRR